MKGQENVTVTGSFATTTPWGEEPCSSFILGGGKENVVFFKSSLFLSLVRPIIRHRVRSVNIGIPFAVAIPRILVVC